jgi:hypothetical protein
MCCPKNRTGAQSCGRNPKKAWWRCHIAVTDKKIYWPNVGAREETRLSGCFPSLEKHTVSATRRAADPREGRRRAAFSFMITNTAEAPRD